MKLIIAIILFSFFTLLLYANKPQEILTLKVFPIVEIDSLGNDVGSIDVTLIVPITVDELIDSLTTLQNTQLNSTTKQQLLNEFIQNHIKKVEQ